LFELEHECVEWRRTETRTADHWHDSGASYRNTHETVHNDAMGFAQASETMLLTATQ
jgi:hypothetical protein